MHKPILVSLPEIEFHTCKLFEQVWSLAEFKYSVFPIVKPGFIVITKAVKWAGRYYFRQNVIELNAAYYPGIDAITTAAMEETITHEICHALQYKVFPRQQQWHGPEFRQLMQSFGYAGDTYHNHSVREAKAVAQSFKTDKRLQLADF